jgi:hypothetical protein
MPNTRPSPAEGTTTVNIPLFLTSLPRTSKSHEIFKLMRLCHIAVRVETYKAKTGLTQCYNCQNSAMSGLIADSLRVVCGVEAVTCTRNTQKRVMRSLYRPAANASWWRERNLIPPTTEAAAMPRKRCKRERVAESAQEYNGMDVLFQPQPTRAVLRDGATQKHKATAAASAALSCTGLRRHSGRYECPPSLEAQPLTSTKSVSRDSYCNQFFCERHVQISRSDNSDLDRAQCGRVRRQNNDHHNNYIKTHEAKWPLVFLGGKYDCAGEDQHQL